MVPNKADETLPLLWNRAGKLSRYRCDWLVGMTTKRRFLQVPLRYFLLLFTTVSLLLGWLIPSVLDQQRAVAIVEGYGGNVWYDYQTHYVAGRRVLERRQPMLVRIFGDLGNYIFCDVISVKVVGPGCDSLEAITAFKKLSALELRNPAIRDLEPLSDLPQLRFLKIEFEGPTSVSDLSPLSNLKHLERFTLTSAPVSDLGPIAELRMLNYLDISDTYVSDLTPVARLSKLSYLDLKDTFVTDLKPLGMLSNLTTLSIRRTLVRDVTPLADLANLKYVTLNRIPKIEIDRLRRALPTCAINF